MNKLALCFTKLALSLAVLSVFLLPVLCTAPAHAAGIEYSTWVSGAGSDNNSGNGCPQSAPCATFATAFAQTNVGGVINCAGPVINELQVSITITYSVTIDCHDMLATVLLCCGASGIVINAPGSDVTLRNLTLNGIDTGTLSPSADGVLIQAAARVEIDNCKLMNFSQRGIDDVRTTGSTQLFVRNSVIRGNTGTGIALAAAAKNSVVIENVQSIGNAYGVAAATGNNAVVSRSVMSENSVAGIYTDPGAQIFVDNTVISHNITTGVQANGTVVLGNSDITYNTAGITGATTSYGNNRIFGNGATTTPTMAAQQ